jgi:hypothetical protein
MMLPSADHATLSSVITACCGATRAQTRSVVYRGRVEEKCIGPDGGSRPIISPVSGSAEMPFQVRGYVRAKDPGELGQNGRYSDPKRLERGARMQICKLEKWIWELRGRDPDILDGMPGHLLVAPALLFSRGLVGLLVRSVHPPSTLL